MDGMSKLLIAATSDFFEENEEGELVNVTHMIRTSQPATTVVVGSSSSASTTTTTQVTTTTTASYAPIRHEKIRDRNRPYPARRFDASKPPAPLRPHNYEEETIAEFRRTFPGTPFKKTANGNVITTILIPKGTQILIPGKSISRSELGDRTCFQIRNPNTSYKGDLFKCGSTSLKVGKRSYTLYLKEDEASERDADGEPTQRVIDLSDRLFFIKKNSLLPLRFGFDKECVLAEQVDAQWLAPSSRKDHSWDVLHEIPFAKDDEVANLTVELYSDEDGHPLECKKVYLVAVADIQPNSVLRIEKAV